MRRIGIFVLIAGLLGLGIWNCGDDSSSPTGPGETVTATDYAVSGVMLTMDLGSLGKRAKTSVPSQMTMVSVGIQKNDGTADISNWPDQEATEVKLIGPREITLTASGFDMYMLPEGETLAPGEAYKLRITVEGRTFTSKKAVKVLDAPTITTADEQYIDPGASFTVQWNAVSGAAGYAVELTSYTYTGETVVDTTFAVGTATQKVLPGALFGEEGEYEVSVIAYDETMAPYIALFMQERFEFPSIYDFDDPKVQGLFCSMAIANLYVWVGEGEGEGEGIVPIGQIDISVSGGTTPTFSWTGGNAQVLSVIPDEGDNHMWAIITPSDSGFASPVKYGQLPSGAMQIFPPSPLMSGTPYTVVVLGVQAGAVGEKEFTP